VGSPVAGTPYPGSGGYPYGPATRFTITGVQPPADGYLGPSDQLAVRVMSPNVAIDFSVGLRFLDLKGAVQPLLYPIQAPATAGADFILPIQLAEGFLLSAVAFGASVKRGQCFVQFYIARQKAASAEVVADVIFQGYITATDYVGYPVSKAESSLSGRGFISSLPAPAAAAGTPLTYVVPPGVRWSVQYCIVIMVGAGGGERGTLQVFDAAANLVLDAFNDVNLTPAPLEQQFQKIGVDNLISPGFDMSMLQRDLILLAGWSVVLTAIPALPPAAVMGPAVLVVEEWVEV
jgi:hypothetical protein